MRRTPARFAVVAIGCCAIWLGASSSHAHLGGAEGVIPFVDDGALVGAGTTWGLVAAGGDGAFSQTCEESIGDVPRAFLQRTGSDGVIRTLAATARGVMATVDGGCTWTAVPGTQGRSMTALVSSPTSPETLWATTASVDDDNAVIVSHDGGATFAVLQAVPAGVLLTSLAVGVVVGGDDDGLDRLLVAGVDTVAREPLLLLGTSSGLLPAPVGPLEGAQLVRALAVDDDALWFSTLDQIGRGHVFRVPVTTDGAAVEVGSFDGLVKAAASVAGFRFVIAAGGLLFRARATDLEAPVVDQSVWTRTVDGPLQCLHRVAGDERLWGCATPTAGTWFKATTDGETWQDMLPVDDVGEHVCPSQTPGAELCAYQLVEPGTDDADDEAPAPPSSSSCSQSDGHPDVSVLVAVGVLSRRRRLSRR
jgi:hypothetical protein